jgi:phage repressor protein C with HTH and peptisase S24 domain
MHGISPAWLLTAGGPMKIGVNDRSTATAVAAGSFTGDSVAVVRANAYLAAEPMAAWHAIDDAHATADTTRSRGGVAGSARPTDTTGALLPHDGAGTVRPLVFSLPVGDAGGRERSVEYYVIPRHTRPASAGPGFGGVDDVVDLAGDVAYTASWLQRNLGAVVGNISTVQVDGGSMAPTLLDGETIVIDEGVKSVEKDGIYVLERYNSRRVKRVQKRSDGGLVLLSDNPAYPPEVLDRADAQLLNVVGRMIMPRVK